MDDERPAASGGPVCATCGRAAPADGTAVLTWTRGHERGRELWTCDRCARANLRSIEAKLDTEWW